MSETRVLHITQQHVKCLKNRQSDIEKNNEFVCETVLTF